MASVMAPPTAGVNDGDCPRSWNRIVYLIACLLLPFLFPASTARHLYLRGGVGVGSMIKIYGGRKRNGVCPSHFSVGSKNVARKVLQALEALKMVEKDPNG